jgi:hypothetical protein
MRITKRNGRSNCMRYEKQTIELKAIHEEGKATERDVRSNREM